MSANLENGDDMICILLGFQIENQRWKPDDAKRSCGEDSALKAGCGSIAQNVLRRSCGEAEIVRQFVEEALNARWCFERPQHP